jgi:hypothetical protein
MAESFPWPSLERSRGWMQPQTSPNPVHRAGRVLAVSIRNEASKWFLFVHNLRIGIYEFDMFSERRVIPRHSGCESLATCYTLIRECKRYDRHFTRHFAGINGPHSTPSSVVRRPPSPLCAIIRRIVDAAAKIDKKMSSF